MRPYIDSIMTNEQKIARDLDKFGKDVIEAAKLGVEITDAQKELATKAIQERYATKPPTLSEQAGSGLQAMAFRSLESYQTQLQTQDPNTKLLEEVVSLMTDVRRSTRENTTATNRTNEILESPA